MKWVKRGRWWIESAEGGYTISCSLVSGVEKFSAWAGKECIFTGGRREAKAAADSHYRAKQKKAGAGV